MKYSRRFHIVYGLAFIAALVGVGFGIYQVTQEEGYLLLILSGLATILVTVTWPLATILAVLRKQVGSTLDQTRELLDDRMQQVSVMLDLMSEQQMLSDRTKSVAFREKDREAIRRAIQEDMAKGDYEAALTLADEIADAFGYRVEAERIRQEIAARRGDVIRRQISDAMAVVERYCRGEQWNEAHEEAVRLMRIYPDNAQIQSLPTEIDNRRAMHKRRLQESWQEAVAKRDVDGSIEILKQLDMYLSASEAEAMQETARGVFKEKINILREQFAHAVQEQRWREAIRIGDAIIADFPNTKMAQEVRDKMEVLRQRANEPASPVSA